MTVPQILEKKLENANIPGVLRLAEDYAADSLTVQLKESDLAFLSRLCEHEGIAFHFEHRTSSGELTDHIVFSDTNEALAPADATLTLKQNRRGDRTDVFALERQSKMTSNYFVVADYCDRRPALDLTAEFEVAEEGAGGVVEYGSNHSSIEQGLRLARVRGEEAASTKVEYLGQSDAPAITAARKLKLDDVDGPSNLELLVIEVTHRFTTRPAATGSPSSSDDDSPSGRASLEYENSFRAIPFTQTFRPPARHRSRGSSVS